MGGVSFPQMHINGFLLLTVALLMSSVHDIATSLPSSYAIHKGNHLKPSEEFFFSSDSEFGSSVAYDNALLQALILSGCAPLSWPTYWAPLLGQSHFLKHELETSLPTNSLIW